MITWTDASALGHKL